jgi:hypothetical protein
MAISAKRKDGTAVQVGDRVLAIWSNNKKFFGRITEIGGVIRLRERRYVPLQIYKIRCDDGQTRPAHAWHIKAVFTAHTPKGEQLNEKIQRQQTDRRDQARSLKKPLALG